MNITTLFSSFRIVKANLPQQILLMEQKHTFPFAAFYTGAVASVYLTDSIHLILKSRSK